MPKRLTPIARKLRRTRTETEDLLWSRLRNRQLGNAKFRFQSPVGDHVADFLCAEVRLILELDGSHHATQVEADTLRTQSLEQAGYTVLRFWNSDVTGNLEGVLQKILDTLHTARNTPLR